MYIYICRSDEASYSEEGKISNSNYDDKNNKYDNKRNSFSTYVSTDPYIRSPRGNVIQRGESGSDFSDWERFVIRICMCMYINIYPSRYTSVYGRLYVDM
jgi:spore cortex formation protein SpoVR/YcgB (stage V sporulation)